MQVITLSDVNKSYQGKDGIFALKNATLDFKQGEFVAIVGKSGSGKSTLLNMITGIDSPTSGEILFSGKSLQSMNEKQLSLWRGKHIGIVFQFFQLIPTLTVIENIMLPMDFAHTYNGSKRKQRAMELLKRTGVQMYANELPSKLSGGEQQRVAIARSLANDPPFIVADEPTGNLDSITSLRIIEVFKSLVTDGKAVIIITHSSELAEQANRIITINDGMIVSDTVRAV